MQATVSSATARALSRARSASAPALLTGWPNLRVAPVAIPLRHLPPPYGAGCAVAAQTSPASGSARRRCAPATLASPPVKNRMCALTARADVLRCPASRGRRTSVLKAAAAAPAAGHGPALAAVRAVHSGARRRREVRLVPGALVPHRRWSCPLAPSIAMSARSWGFSRACSAAGRGWVAVRAGPPCAGQVSGGGVRKRARRRPPPPTHAAPFVRLDSPREPATAPGVAAAPPLLSPSSPETPPPDSSAGGHCPASSAQGARRNEFMSQRWLDDSRSLQRWS
jgi:hypothetical protein